MADITMTDTMSPGLLKVMERAKRDPQARLRGVARFIDEAALTRAFHALRKDAAVGVDGITKDEYGRELESNIRDLHERLRTGRYRHQRIRRVGPGVNAAKLAVDGGAGASWAALADVSPGTPGSSAVGRPRGS